MVEEIEDNESSAVNPKDQVHEDTQDAGSVVFPAELERYASRQDGEMHLEMSDQSVPLTTMSVLGNYMSLLNAPVVRLSLSRNCLGADGAELLGKALVTNNTLEVLELDDCGLVGSPYRPEFEGIMSLAKGIQSVRSNLRHLSLAHNGLLPNGCRILLGALTLHPTLTSLDISDNLLSVFDDKQGYLALSYVLQYSKQLSRLVMGENPLPKGAWDVLMAGFATNSSLTSLDIRRCGITRDQFDELLLAQPESANSALTELLCDDA
ncbi:hypothetical protein Poli38472_011526 [Pythium oligandrum]|uniref:Uncharacterized protein n=1 Tax=Pythium oligandrum TaxID=41045 RepID=A0A8K1CL01_PYTOL|nr:hypothetical protein Poli38472_011526 [Pythium oligandrum]|eukprot:TMW64646.1 hypothetical protein Poli38472_011526 [Pythium oligandrum]